MRAFFAAVQKALIVGASWATLWLKGGGRNMAANAVVRARISERIKKEAEAVLATIGLTVSDAFRLLMVRVAAEKALPFEPLVPNKDTVKAIEAARRGKLTTAGGTGNLLHHLNADD
jgi:DNA-damage-inducible protein J